MVSEITMLPMYSPSREIYSTVPGSVSSAKEMPSPERCRVLPISSCFPSTKARIPRPATSFTSLTRSRAGSFP